jgi:hypothetical protein
MKGCLVIWKRLDECSKCKQWPKWLKKKQERTWRHGEHNDISVEFRRSYMCKHCKPEDKSYL